MSTYSLRQFGANFLGPVSVYFCEQLRQQNVPLYFLAREGYFLEKMYQHYQYQSDDKGQSCYMLASRAFMFRLLLDDQRSYVYSLKGEFSGTFYELLRTRFMISNTTIQRYFSQKIQSSYIHLPEDFGKASELLCSQAKNLSAIVAPTKAAYLEYLASIGIDAQSTMHIVDLGYSGTIQKLLTLLLNKPSVGHYLIASKPGKTRIKRCELEMKGYLKEGVSMGDGYLPLDRSMFLEALLTSPQGQFQDIRHSQLPHRDFEFYYGRKVNAQKYIHQLEMVMQGAKEYVIHAVKHQIYFSSTDVEQIITQYIVKPHMIPRALWPLFAIDDDIAGNGTVDPLQFFGLR